MIGLISILIVAGVAFVVVRVGSVALERTGLSRESANFQAISAFFGTGFTTGESELVVNHPVRRRIIRDLIIVGNIGLTGALGAFVITFVRAGSPGEQGRTLLLLIGGIALLWWASRTRVAVRLIDRTLNRLGPGARVHAHDYSRLLRVSAGFGVDEVRVEEGAEAEGMSLADLALRSRHGVMVLGIERADEEFLATPDGDTRLRAGDELTVYGKDSEVARFAKQCSAAKEEGDSETPEGSGR